MEFDCINSGECVAQEVSEKYLEKEVRPGDGKRKCGRVRDRCFGFKVKVFPAANRKDH